VAITITDRFISKPVNHMKQHSILAAMAAFVLAMTFTTTAFAQGKGAETFKFPFENPSYYNPCCDEWISLSGLAHVTVRGTTNADGSITYTINQNISNAKGTGLSSGISYHFNEPYKDTYVFTADPFSVTDGVTSFTTHVVGKGKGGRDCSVTIKVSYHYSIDEFGYFTIEQSNVEFICANGSQISQALPQ
jgi:hypothetical protein